MLDNCVRSRDAASPRAFFPVIAYEPAPFLSHAEMIGEKCVPRGASKLIFIDWTLKPLVNRRVISLDTVASLLRGDTVPGDTASS